MTRLTRCAAVCATLVLSMATPALAKGKCVMAGGEATMVTEDLAKFMAGAALKNSIAGMGATPSGAVAVKCTPGVLTYCIARQRACK